MNHDVKKEMPKLPVQLYLTALNDKGEERSKPMKNDPNIES